MMAKSRKAIAAAMVATIAVSILLASCEGRKMSNMKPTGDTVEVVIEPTQEDVAIDPTQEEVVIDPTEEYETDSII